MIMIFIIHHLMMYIIHFICVFLPGKYKPLLEMKCVLEASRILKSNDKLSDGICKNQQYYQLTIK